MSIQEPAWLKRTRPCPFFSQGRCLFADSCNFLHDVKVRSAVNQLLPRTVQVKQPSPFPRPVFDPPFVVVNSASPRSGNLTSPQSPISSIQASRYSGLLSVLSDVIGPPPDPPTGEDAVPSNLESAAHGDAGLLSEYNPCVASVESTSTVTEMETGQGTPSRAETSSVLEFDSKDTLIDSFGYPMEPLLPEGDGESVAEFLAVLDNGESGNVDTTSYFVEAAETYVVGSEAEEEDNEDMDDPEEDPTVMLSNRQSTLSSFTGASLLASPRHSILAELSVASPIENSALDLLSPVQLSVKLRPFPIPSLGLKVKRGDSIDSGYADGDSWVSPLPFSRSPPGNFRSPVAFTSHSRRASLSSPALNEGRISHDVGALRLFPHNPIEVIMEVECDRDSEENEDAAYTILNAYEDLDDPLRVNIVEEKAKEDGPSDVSIIMRGSRRYSLEYLRPPGEHDPDSCNQPSFISDDDLSFKTALSTQPSSEDLSNISRASLVKQDSLLSSISGCSTSNTSVLSQRSIVGEFPCLVNRTDRVGLPEIGAPGVDVDVQFDPPCADNLQGRVLEKVASPCGSDNLSPGPPGPNDHQESVGGSAVAPREGLSCILHCDQHSPKSEPSTRSYGSSLFKNVRSYGPQDSDGMRNGLPANTGVPQRNLSGDVHFDEHSSKSSPSVDNSGCSSSVKNVLGYASAGVSNAQDLVSASVVPQDRLSCVLRFAGPSPQSSLSSEIFHRSSVVMDVLEHELPEADSHHSRSSEPLESVLHGHPAEYVAVGQNLVVKSLDSDGVIESLDSEHDSFTQRLSFPLPPPFLPAEIVGHFTVNDEEDTPVLSEAVVASVEKDMSQDEEMEGIHLASDLTEKARLSQLPPVGYPHYDTDFTLQRSRAASDLTVKGNSPLATITGDTPGIPRSSSPLFEQPSRPESVQSLYDQYFDDGSSDDGSRFSNPAHNYTTTPDVSRSVEEPFLKDHLQSLDLTPHVLQRISSPSPDNESGNFGTDSLQSEPVLRPLLTGRRSILRSFLSLIPTASLVNAKASSPHAPARLQARAIGSTMVPLGFRRHKSQAVATQSLQPLRTMLPASELREVLRIRTDIPREEFPPGCSSASVSFATRSPLPVKAMSAPPTGGLRQLRLSSIANKRYSISSAHSSSIASSTLSLDQLCNSSIPQSPSVSSTTSFSRNSLLSPSCEQIPEQMHHTLTRSSSNSPTPQANDDVNLTSQSLSRRDSRSVSASTQQLKSWRLSHYRAGSRNFTSADSTHRFSRSSTLVLPYSVDEQQEIDEDVSTTSCPIQSRSADDRMRPPILAPPAHAIATPKPTLLFAIASDNVDQVRQVLESGEAGPNDFVGPQSALAFTLTNDKLAHKQEIVKALLAYGANPAALRNPVLNPAPRIEGGDVPSRPPSETTLEGMDPATRYFITRADAVHTRQTSQLIYRSFFRPLTRVRYDVIGQDWALEQLFRVLSMHSQKLAVAPIVVLLCGPSGHGKSLLARKFGSLLDVPTHTVNMTTLRSAHDIWQSYSMSPYEESQSVYHVDIEFLIENEGNRCVVVLDEIEKVEDQKALWSLLIPWELGRCSLEAGKRHVDARNVIWLGTSNVGHELVFEHHENRAEPDKRMSHEEYLELTGLLRPRVSQSLGASLVSRVTTVLPFVPFTLDEKEAIAAETVYALAGDSSRLLSPQDVESLVIKALLSYHPSEGARSLHRAISSILVGTI